MADPIATAVAEWLTANSTYLLVGSGTAVTAFGGFMLRTANKFISWIKPQIIETVGKHNHMVDVATQCLGRLSGDVEHLKKEADDSKKMLVEQSRIIGEVHEMLKAEEFPVMTKK